LAQTHFEFLLNISKITKSQKMKPFFTFLFSNIPG
jgi:hypothetical protein